jgi:hypothetical protein
MKRNIRNELQKLAGAGSIETVSLYVKNKLQGRDIMKMAK